MEVADGPEPFLTMREAVMEIRRDVKSLTNTTASKLDVEALEVRVRSLEKSSIRLSGAWATLGIAASVLAGLAGLAVGVAAFILN